MLVGQKSAGRVLLFGQYSAGRVLLVGHLEVTSAMVPLQTLPPTLPAHQENRGDYGDDDN